MSGVLQQANLGFCPNGLIGLEEKSVLQPQMGGALSEGGQKRVPAEQRVKGGLLLGIGQIVPQVAQAGVGRVAEEHPLEPPSSAFGVQNPVIGQIQPGQGQHVRRQILLIGLELLEAGGSRFPGGDILSPAQQPGDIACAVNLAQPGNRIPAPAVAVIIAAVFHSLCCRTLHGPAHSGRQAPLILG